MKARASGQSGSGRYYADHGGFAELGRVMAAVESVRLMVGEKAAEPAGLATRLCGVMLCGCERKQLSIAIVRPRGMGQRTHADE